MDERQFKAEMGRTGHVASRSEMHLYMHAAAQRARKITARLNARFCTARKVRALFSKLTGSRVGEDFSLFPPFYTDYGRNITVGSGVFINSGCCFQDQGGIEIGSGTLVGQQVVIATINHSMTPARRGDMDASSVKIGRNVWIGAHATILPGVTIGDGSVVAAGAVVSRDVPQGAVVAGVPAKVIRSITEENIE